MSHSSKPTMLQQLFACAFVEKISLSAAAPKVGASREELLEAYHYRMAVADVGNGYYETNYQKQIELGMKRLAEAN